MAMRPPSPARVPPTRQHRRPGTPAKRLDRTTPSTLFPLSNFAAVNGDFGVFGKKSYTAACSSPACLTSTIQCDVPAGPPRSPNIAPSIRSIPSSGTHAMNTSAAASLASLVDAASRARSVPFVRPFARAPVRLRVRARAPRAPRATPDRPTTFARVARAPARAYVASAPAAPLSRSRVRPDFGDGESGDARGEGGARASVRSVSGARCRDAAAARARFSRAVARRRDAGGGGRFALLCVSGDGDRGGGMTSEDVLREARGMRARGEVPRETTLLAAVNPMLGASEAVRMLRKRECGADGFISQPALLQNRFEAWREACERSGALDGLDGGGDGALAGLFLGVSTARTAKSLEF